MNQAWMLASMSIVGLKYKLFGKVVRSRNKAKAFRNSMRDALHMQDQSGQMDLHDVAIREGVLYKRRQDLVDAARVVYQSGGDVSNELQLRDLFKQMEMLSMEQRVLSKTRDALLGAKMAKDHAMSTFILEQQVIDEHNSRQIRGIIRPSLKSVGIKATKNQIDREIENDIRQDISSFSIDEEETEEENGQVDENRFRQWLTSLKGEPLVGETVQKQGHTERENLEKRIMEMKHQ